MHPAFFIGSVLTKRLADKEKIAGNNSRTTTEEETTEAHIYLITVV